MEDAVYFANILRSRECAVCGADRMVSPSLAGTDCSVCHGPVDSAHALLAIAKGAAKVACAIPCLEVVLQEGLVGGDACPACGSPWGTAAPHPRTCRTCAKALAFDAGYLGLFEVGRLRTFCSTACLEMHEARVNPFCG
ncbi:MAG: hypothetical protein AABX97_02100 [Candidatus Thermoplasmatota archaeon]